MARRRRGSTNTRTGRRQQNLKDKADSREGDDPAEKVDDSVTEETRDSSVVVERVTRSGRRSSGIKRDEIEYKEISTNSVDARTETVHIESLQEDPAESSVQSKSQDMPIEIEDSEDCISNDYFEDESKIESVSNSKTLMPQDIQQIVLGDLKGVTVGQGDEIIVSHEEEIVWEEGVVEEVICDDGIEMEVDTQDLVSDEEENSQVVVVNSQDKQYLIVVNDSDSNDVVTTEDNVSDDDDNADIDDNASNSDDHNEVQEGSCEIITVVKGSDNENSQDSASLNCDTINAVIGSGVNIIENVTISEYHSDEENIITNEESISKEENSSAFSILQKHLFSNDNNKDSEMNNGSTCSTAKDGQSGVIENSNLNESADEEINVSLQNVKLSSSHVVYHSDDSNSQLKLQSTEHLVVISDNYDKQQSVCVLGEQHELVKELVVLKHEDISISSTSEKDDGTQDNGSEDSGKLNQGLYSSSSIIKSSSSSLKTPCDSTVDEVCTAKRNKLSDSFDGQEVSSSQPDITNSEKCVDDFSVFKTLSSSQNFEKNCESNEEQNLIVKEKADDISIPDEEKHPIFRSRSGSTDTTGSESGSNSSSGRRRSNRLRSIGMMKQQSESENSKTAIQKDPTAPGTPVPPVPGYEADKPVKVKSRWRRSSELEMGSRRSIDMEIGSTKTDSDNAPTPPCSFQPSTPPNSPPLSIDVAKDKEMEEKLRNFQHIAANEYLTER